MNKQCDFFISGGPTQFLITPTDARSHEHLQKIARKDSLWLGQGLMVKHQQVDGIIRALEFEDFLVRRWEEFEGDLMCFQCAPEYVVQEIESDDPYYAASCTHSGEYRVIHVRSGTCEAEGFNSRCEALLYIDQLQEERK
jgi:hypothetical protein